MNHQTVLILDFGGQYSQLIARRVRECNVYCEIFRYDVSIEKIKNINPIAIIFTGGPNSVYEDDSPIICDEVFELGIPVLGICYGAQLIGYCLGGKIESSPNCEYGKTKTFYYESELFSGLERESYTWMSHTDFVSEIPNGFVVTAKTSDCPVAAMEDSSRKLYAVQFHPEVSHTFQGNKIIENFLYKVCNAQGDWTMNNYSLDVINQMKSKIGSDKVLLALSGGVDSSVAAAILSKAVGSNLTCIFVDHGLMRKNEGDEIEQAFKGWDINFIRVDAKDRFLSKLKGVVDPEKKRKIIGEEFIRVFEQQSNELGAISFLAQGTIYPDVIESGAGSADVIKSHHNVGGIPDNIKFKEIIEPLRLLFKDEVRNLGISLGLPSQFVKRQPFPGPGLAIRIMGEVTDVKLEALKHADFVFRDEIAKADFQDSVDQYFAVLTDTKSVGVMGDGRTYENVIALRAVTTSDFMTADFARIPYDILEKASVRIVNEVKGVNRVVYDITAKPPSTIEWE